MNLAGIFKTQRHYSPEQDGDANLLLLAYNQKTGEVITIEFDQLKALIKEGKNGRSPDQKRTRGNH